eukprot:SAG31_NODE_657_length_13108_cov_3.079330_1_plen_143_part_00
MVCVTCRVRARLAEAARLDPKNRQAKAAKAKAAVSVFKSSEAATNAKRNHISNAEYTAAFRQIEESTGVSDVDQLLERYDRLTSTKAQLHRSIANARSTVSRLENELDALLDSRDQLLSLSAPPANADWSKSNSGGQRSGRR